MYTPASSLLSVGRIGQARWIAALTERGAHDPARIVSLYHAYADGLGINPDLALSQACEECAYFTSRRWVEQRNPCGLGIVADDTPGHVFDTRQRGIIAHIHHLCCYVYLAAQCPVDHATTPDFRHTFHDGQPALSHLQDETRRWATKPGYVARILAIANRLLPPEEPSMSVPKPPLTKRASPNRGYPGDYIPQAVVWHISQGSEASNLSWLTNPASGASSNYLVGRTGTIYELVDPEAGQRGAAWCNGDVEKPDRANALIDAWVRANINPNRRTVSIECSGFTSKWRGGSLTIKQVDALVRLTAWVCDRFGIAPDRAHILRHQQINDVDKHDCPGFSVAEMDDWIGRVAALVNPPQPQRPPGWLNVGDADVFRWEGEGVIVERRVVYFNPVKQRYYEREWHHERGYTPWKEIA